MSTDDWTLLAYIVVVGAIAITAIVTALTNRRQRGYPSRSTTPRGALPRIGGQGGDGGAGGGPSGGAGGRGGDGQPGGTT